MAFTRTHDGDEPVRVNKWLAQGGVCSRREADALIADGLVSIDGVPISDAGRKIAPGETLTLAGRADADLAARITIVVHKPPGMVSAHPEPHQWEARDLVTTERRIGAGPDIAPDRSLPPMGRLDLESRGLLLLGDDGVVAKAVIGPASRLDKEYEVRVDGAMTQRKVELLRHGLWLDGRPLKPATVKAVGAGRLRFILREGRNRQIRRMCELVELVVTDLQRVRIGPVHLGDLPEGAWRVLSASERAALIAEAE